MANTSISDWELAVFAETLGYDSVWFGDSQMIWSDVYACLAVAATRWKRINEKCPRGGIGRFSTNCTPP